MIQIAQNWDGLWILGAMSRMSGNAGLKNPAC